jgi:adenylylsulfate kinase
MLTGDLQKEGPKGANAKLKIGEITNFTGIGQDYEIPINPEITLDTDKETVQQCSQKIMQKLKDLGYLE